MRYYRFSIARRYAFIVPAVVSLLGLAAHPINAANLMTYEITADEMCCKGCAKKVAAQLYTAPGVTNVQANIKARTVTVTAKPSAKLTAERLWNAVEKGKGKPSKLVSADATYTLTRPDQLGAEEQSAPGMYAIVIAGLKASGAADEVGRELHAMRGVKSIVTDLDRDSLLVEPQQDVHLSPWALAAAVERTQQEPLAISGPHGRLTIKPAAAQLSSRQTIQGDIR